MDFASSTENDHLQHTPRKRRKLSRRVEWEGNEEGYQSTDEDEEGKGKSNASKAAHDSSTPQIYTTCGDEFFSPFDTSPSDHDLLKIVSSNSSAVQKDRNVTNEAALTSDVVSPSSLWTLQAESNRVVCFGMVSPHSDYLIP